MRHLRCMFIAVVCVGMSFGIVFAQDDALKGGTVRGLITDLTPVQNPIEGVTVKIVAAQDAGKEWTTKTNADGEYKQSGLPAGRYLIRISKEGYDERTGKPVTVVDGGEHFIPLKMTRKGAIKPFLKVRPDERMNVVIKQRIVSLIQRVAEGVGKRYALDETVINAFHQSVLNSIGNALEQEGGLSIFARAVEEGNMLLLEMLLAHPGCQAAFAKHLSEVQLQDYLEFIAAREVRDRQAVVQWIAVTLDKELSLRADQREKVGQSLLDTAESGVFPNTMNALWLSPEQAAQLAHYRLKISLDGVLSEAQSKVWRELVNANTNIEQVFVVDPETLIEMEEEFEVVIPGPFVEMEKQFKAVIEDIVVDPPGKLPPWIELNADTVESPEQMMEIAEAKLAAHTELLGPLDERAAWRLALVTKGVAQEYIEARDEAGEAILQEFERRLLKVVEADAITRKQAAIRLQAMRKNLRDEDRINSRRGEASASDITRDGLYQQTIKDVLSEEAFAAYSEHRAEREALRQQALRGMVVACIDIQLLLDDMQRGQLETAASQLVPGPLKEGSSSISMFFQLFPQTVDFEVLTPWQQDEFKRVFGPIGWRR